MVNDPILLTVGRLEESVVPWPEGLGTGIGAEEGMIDLAPAARIQGFGV